MINSYEIIYTGGKLEAIQAGVLSFVWPITGTLKNVWIKCNSVVSGSTSYFNIRNNGSPLWTGTDRLGVSSGSPSSEKTSLAVDVVKKQAGRLDLDSLAGGNITGPVYLVLDIEDNIQTEQEDVVKTTASLANDASEDGTVSLGKTFVLNKIAADRECRVRLYQTAAFRTADAARPVGIDPEGEHGLICDFNLTTGNLTWNSSPIPNGANGDTSRTADIYYSIQNKSGGSSTVEVTFSVVKIEE